MLNKIKLSILDFYLDWPLLTDTILVIVIFLIPDRLICLNLLSEDNYLDLLSNMISTCVSLAGFIITALTVIVAFKSNVAARGLKEATNALDLIISSKLYPKIVKVYTKAIMEFLFLTVSLYLSWVLFKNIPTVFYELKLIVSGILCIGLTFARSLYILIIVLEAEQVERK